MSRQTRRTFLKGAVASVPPLLAVAGKPVRLVFELKDADLYSFKFE